MKAGNLILLLIVLLIAFGFLLKDDMEVRSQQKLVQDQIDDLNRQLKEAKNLLAACQEQNSQDTDTINKLQSRIDELEDEKQGLNHQLTDYSRRMAVLESQGSFLDFLNSNPILLGGALLVQLITGAIRYTGKAGILFPNASSSPSDEYMRVSPQERAWILRKRWIDQDKNANR